MAIQHQPDYVRRLALHVELIRALEPEDANLRALEVALFYLSESQRGL